jgi:hypothetical protein
VAIWQRFESEGPSSVLELESGLTVVRMTHELLSEHLGIRTFESMLLDVNECACCDLGLSQWDG